MARKLIDSLDSASDLDLSELKISRRSLAASGPYGPYGFYPPPPYGAYAPPPYGGPYGGYGSL